MPDDDAEPNSPPIARYIADGKAEDNRLVSAQNVADQLGLNLSELANLLAQLPSPTAEELRELFWKPWPESLLSQLSQAGLSGSAVTVSVASGDFAQAWDAIKITRFPAMEKLSSKFPKNRAEISPNQIILVSVLLVAALYPVLPPDVQKLLTTEAGLMSAIAAILALLKSERKK